MPATATIVTSTIPARRGSAGTGAMPVQVKGDTPVFWRREYLASDASLMSFDSAISDGDEPATGPLEPFEHFEVRYAPYNDEEASSKDASVDRQGLAISTDTRSHAGKSKVSLFFSGKSYVSLGKSSTLLVAEGKPSPARRGATAKIISASSVSETPAIAQRQRQHRQPSIASLSGAAATATGRKQPPKLTESLELLSTFHKASFSSSSKSASPPSTPPPKLRQLSSASSSSTADSTLLVTPTAESSPLGLRRKQPPRLTESLECIEAGHRESISTASSSPGSSPSKPSTPLVKMRTDSMVSSMNKQFNLSVAALPVIEDAPVLEAIVSGKAVRKGSAGWKNLLLGNTPRKSSLPSRQQQVTRPRVTAASISAPAPVVAKPEAQPVASSSSSTISASESANGAFVAAMVPPRNESLPANRARRPSTDSGTPPSLTHSASTHSSAAPSSSSTRSSALVSGPACSVSDVHGSVCGHGGDWSLFEELEYSDRIARQRARHGSRAVAGQSRKKETRKEKKARKRSEAEAFDEFAPPTPQQLFAAGELEVIDEHGHRKKFEEIVRDRKTIVIFIRHWFCSLCAQYMNSILAEVSPEALEEANVDLVIIGNGSNKMLNGYKDKFFKCPFKMYTDPSLALYRALGLTRQTPDAGKDEDKGDYIVQSAMEQTLFTIKRAGKMPLFHNPGHFFQLGGEFIFDSPLSVSYTHRMINTRNHAPIRDICAKAGVFLKFIHYEPGPAPPPVHRWSDVIDDLREEEEAEAAAAAAAAQEGDDVTDFAAIASTTTGSRRGSAANTLEGDDWEEERNADLERIRRKKSQRRKASVYVPADEAPEAIAESAEAQQE